MSKLQTFKQEKEKIMDKYYDNGRPETVTGDFGTAWITTQDNDDETIRMVRAVVNSSIAFRRY